MVALHLIILARGHAIIAQVIESKLRSGPIGNAAVIHLPPTLGVHRLLDASDRDTQKIIQMPHPLRVAAR